MFKYANSNVRKKMDKLLSKSAVKELVGVSSVTLYQWMKAGKFPRAIRLQSHKRQGKIAWFASEVQQWMEERERVRYKGDPKPDPKPKKKGREG